MIAVLVVLIGYLVGSIPFGVLVGRVYRGVDVRDYGSGKSGFTNTLRSLGWGAALIVIAADIAKGAMPVLLGRYVFEDPWAVALGGVAAVAGHMFPIFAGFRGGRGAATAFGGFTVIAPIAGAVLIVCAAIALAATRYASLTTITATAAGCIAIVALVAAGWLPVHYLLFAFAVTASIELGHIGNIRRLINGVEPKLGQGGTPRAGGA